MTEIQKNDIFIIKYHEIKGEIIMKEQDKGITLIALVVTVIVLLVLASVVIRMITGDDGILNKASEAKTKTAIAQETENFQLQLSKLKLLKLRGEETLSSFMISKYGAENVEENSDGSVTVTTESGNKYKVTENGKVIHLDE